MDCRHRQLEKANTMLLIFNNIVFAFLGPMSYIRVLGEINSFQSMNLSLPKFILIILFFYSCKADKPKLDRLRVAASRGLDCGVSFDITFRNSTLIYKSRKNNFDSSIKIEKVVADSLYYYADKTLASKVHDTLKGEFHNDGLFANIYVYYSDGRKDSLVFLQQDANDAFGSLKDVNPHFYRLFNTLVQIKANNYCWSIEEGVMIPGRN